MTRGETLLEKMMKRADGSQVGMSAEDEEKERHQALMSLNGPLPDWAMNKSL